MAKLDAKEVARLRGAMHRVNRRAYAEGIAEAMDDEALSARQNGTLVAIRQFEELLDELKGAGE